LRWYAFAGQLTLHDLVPFRGQEGSSGKPLLPLLFGVLTNSGSKETKSVRVTIPTQGAGGGNAAGGGNGHRKLLRGLHLLEGNGYALSLARMAHRVRSPIASKAETPNTENRDEDKRDAETKGFLTD